MISATSTLSAKVVTLRQVPARQALSAVKPCAVSGKAPSLRARFVVVLLRALSSWGA